MAAPAPTPAMRCRSFAYRPQEAMLAIVLALLPHIVAGGNITTAKLGEWTTHLQFPVIPVAGAVLPGQNGEHDKVLVWSAWGVYKFGGPKGYTQSATWDLETGTISPANITQTQHDMFCPGINFDFDGRLLVTGGDNANVTSMYDPLSDQWIRQADMQIPRGYQSATTLSNGGTFTIGGSWSGGRGGKTGEIYDPTNNTWRVLPGCKVSVMLTHDRSGVWRSDNHAWLFSWSKGSVFQAGPSNAMHWYNTNGQGAVRAAGFRNGQGAPDQMCGPAVMFDTGSIFSYGGAPDYDRSPAVNTANIINISAPYQNPVVAWTGSGSFSRIFANTVVLPDGTIMISGGQTYSKLFSDDFAVRIPEIFDPATKTFTQVAEDPTNHTYHSIALLLPDATVLTAGGGMCNSLTQNCKLDAADHFDGNVYRPPYLYDQDGNDAVRPVISRVNGQSIPGPAVQVSTGGTLSITILTNATTPAFSIIRVGSNTHTVNTDQRRISLQANPVGRSTFNATLLNDTGIVLPGIYYLFVVVNGVPSVGATLKVLPS